MVAYQPDQRVFPSSQDNPRAPRARPLQLLRRDRRRRLQRFPRGLRIDPHRLCRPDPEQRRALGLPSPQVAERIRRLPLRRRRNCVNKPLRVDRPPSPGRHLLLRKRWILLQRRTPPQLVPDEPCLQDRSPRHAEETSLRQARELQARNVRTVAAVETRSENRSVSASVNGTGNENENGTGTGRKIRETATAAHREGAAGIASENVIRFGNAASTRHIRQLAEEEIAMTATRIAGTRTTKSVSAIEIAATGRTARAVTKIQEARETTATEIGTIAEAAAAGARTGSSETEEARAALALAREGTRRTTRASLRRPPQPVGCGRTRKGRRRRRRRRRNVNGKAIASGRSSARRREKRGTRKKAVIETGDGAVRAGETTT